MLKTYTLKNGLKVATYEIPQMKSVYLSLAVKGGYVFDTPETLQTAHFMEHILFSATPSFPNEEALYEYVEKLAGSFNASTSSIYINFYIRGPARYLSELIKIGQEVFFQPLFPEAAIEKERGIILEEIRQREDSIAYKNGKFFVETRFKESHPFRFPFHDKKQEVVKRLTKKQLVSYWSRFFHINNTHLVLVGSFKSDVARELIEKTFGKLSPKTKFLGYPKKSSKDVSSFQAAIREDMKLNSCYIDLSFPSAPMEISVKDRITDGIIGNILSGLRTSRLYKLLRHQRGLVYDVSFNSSRWPGTGYSVIYSEVNPEKVEEVVSLIIQELKNFYLSGPTKEELDFAKNVLDNRTLMSFDQPNSIANQLEGDLLINDRVYLPDDVVKISAKITLTDIMKFMRKHWDFKKANLTIQGPIENTPANVRKFSKLIEELR